MRSKSLNRSGTLIAIDPSRQPHLVASRAYLLLHDESGVLIDPGSRGAFPAVLSAVEAHLPLHRLRYLVLTSESPDAAGSLPLWRRTAFSGETVLSWRAYLSVQHYADEMRFLTLKGAGETIALGERRLEFLHLPGLPTLGALCCWDPATKTLFSGQLFGQIQGGEEESGEESLLARMGSYHQIYLHRGPANTERKSLEQFAPLTVCPQHGEPLELPLRRLMTTFPAIDEPAGGRAGATPGEARAEIVAGIRRRLEQLFPPAEVALCLEDRGREERDVDQERFDEFFTTILTRKGYTWLALIDTELRQLCRRAAVEIPGVFTTHRQEISGGIDSLLKEIRQLRSTNFQLQQSIIQTSDDLLRDETTGLYNETFFAEYVTSTIQGGSIADDCVVFLRLDDIKRLNERYGSDAVDQTLQALAFFLMNRKHESTVLFRLSGPTFALYLHKQEKSAAVEYAEELIREVDRSEEFIASISISAAIADNRELSEKEVPDDQFFNELMRLGKERLKTLDRMGPGSICSSSRVGSFLSSSGTVLLIESNDFEAALYTRILEQAGFAVHRARHGSDALTMADQVRPDVIVSEIFVSQMDGFQIRGRLLESQDLRRIPFVLLSREKSAASVERGFELRVARQFRKPVLPAEFSGTIRTLIDEQGRG